MPGVAVRPRIGQWIGDNPMLDQLPDAIERRGAGLIARFHDKVEQKLVIVQVESPEVIDAGMVAQPPIDGIRQAEILVEKTKPAGANGLGTAESA
jgi:hypothetical protein